MTPEQQRIAIGTVCKVGDPMFDSPDYLNDLNAMHEAAMTLRLHQRSEYCVKLRKIIMRDATVEQQDPDSGRITDHAFYEATASQRAEAFLRTLNLYIDEPTV